MKKLLLSITLLLSTLISFAQETIDPIPPTRKGVVLSYAISGVEYGSSLNMVGIDKGRIHVDFTWKNQEVDFWDYQGFSTTGMSFGYNISVGNRVTITPKAGYATINIDTESGTTKDTYFNYGVESKVFFDWFALSAGYTYQYGLSMGVGFKIGGK